jgi:hypothetical protein
VWVGHSCPTLLTLTSTSSIPRAAIPNLSDKSVRPKRPEFYPGEPANLKPELKSFGFFMCAVISDQTSEMILPC